MAVAVGLHQFFKSEPWYRRIAYGLMALLALLYLVAQIAMVVLWFAGQGQLDTV